MQIALTQGKVVYFFIQTSRVKMESNNIYITLVLLSIQVLLSQQSSDIIENMNITKHKPNTHMITTEQNAFDSYDFNSTLFSQQNETPPYENNKSIANQDLTSAWNLLERVRVFKTHLHSYNWSAQFDDRDLDDHAMTIVLSGYYRPGYYGALGFEASSAPITVAMEEFFKQESLLQDYYFDIIMVNHACMPHVGIPNYLRLDEAIDVDVVFGLGCSPVTAPLGYFLSYKDTPVISNFANDPALNDKNSYNTLVRMSFTAKHIGHAVYEVFEEFGWDTVGAFTMRWDQCAYATTAIRDVFIERRVRMTEWAVYDFGELNDDIIMATLKMLKTKARVIILCLPPVDLLAVIDAMYECDMVTPEFAYIYPGSNIQQNKRPWSDDDVPRGSRENRKRRKDAFRYIKMLTLPDFTIDEYQSIQDEFFNKSKLPPFNWDLTGKDPVRDGGVMALYDITYSWLLMVNESMTDGSDPTSGRNIFDKARNRSFTGITGNVVMDDDADRITPYFIWQLTPASNQMTKVLVVTAGNAKGDRISLIDGEEMYWGTSDGLPPPSEPVCGFQDEFCQEITSSWRDTILIVSFIGLAVLVVVSYLITYYYRKKKYEDEINRMLWKVNLEDIIFNDKKSRATFQQSANLSAMSGSQMSVHTRFFEGQFAPVATYKGATVAVKKVQTGAGFVIGKQQMVDLKQLKDLNHENVNPFIGACVDPPAVYVLSTYCRKGSLQDVLGNDDIKLDQEFKASLISDLANGMKYIHGSALICHGRLKSSCCLIDSRWVLKVGNVGLPWLHQTSDSFRVLAKDLLWASPELLRKNDVSAKDMQKADIYSFAIILQEILFRAPPFFVEEYSSEEIVAKVKEKSVTPFRPSIIPAPTDVHPGMLELMTECWSESPIHRPSFADVKRTIARLNKGKKTNIVDSMVHKLEKYADNLAKRTDELVSEKKKTDQLLYRMLPRVVAEKLKSGNSVPPEYFESATVYFSDIVGFTSLSSQSTPMQVVDLLNDLYTCFDDVIALYDVYKVETIGDAYMCVSGIPTKNGDRHSAEIANMALALRTAAGSFVIRHMPEEKLQIRIGAHSGPCAAGVVGLTMPRYCLFGDTVNMASRMESNSIAMKIHLSESTAHALNHIGGYEVKSRGRIEVKGKGNVNTYWLEGQNDDFI